MGKDWRKDLVAWPVGRVKVTNNTYALFYPLRINVGVGLNGGEKYFWEGITNSWLEMLVFFFWDVGPGFGIFMKTMVFFFISHVPYGFVVDGQCIMRLQWFWWDCWGEINGRDIIFGCQCVLLKKMSYGKVWDSGWVGRVGKDDTAENLGRGGVDFL